jgi:hypothetical protein
MCGRPSAFRSIVGFVFFRFDEAVPRQSEVQFESYNGKAKPFRTSGGIAAHLRSAIHDITRGKNRALKDPHAIIRSFSSTAALTSLQRAAFASPIKS